MRKFSITTEVGAPAGRVWQVKGDPAGADASRAVLLGGFR